MSGIFPKGTTIETTIEKKEWVKFEALSTVRKPPPR